MCQRVAQAASHRPQSRTAPAAQTVEFQIMETKSIRGSEICGCVDVLIAPVLLETKKKNEQRFSRIAAVMLHCWPHDGLHSKD